MIVLSYILYALLPTLVAVLLFFVFEKPLQRMYYRYFQWRYNRLSQRR